MEATEHSVMADGCNTHYLCAGSRDNPTLLLVHDGGFGSDAQLCWGRVMQPLARYFHVVAPDLPGFGQTDKIVFLDRSPYDARIPHVARFLERLRINKVFAMGCSFGGSLLIRAMVCEGNPWHVQRGVSISGTGGPFRRDDGKRQLAEFAPTMADAERLTKLIVADGTGLDNHIKRRYQNSLIPGHWEAMMAPRLRSPVSKQPREDTTEFLGEVRRLTIPLLLVEGQQDQLLESGWAEALAQHNDCISVTRGPWGHEPNIDSPQEVLKLVVKFLTGSA